MNADKTCRNVRNRLFAAICLVLCCALVPAPAAAQQRREHRSIIDFLFGRHREPPQRPSHVRPRSNAPRRRKPAPAARHNPPPPPSVQKNADARDVLVLGDFVASGLADGLEEAFAEAPGVVVTDRTNGSSGLVRDDYYDWSASIGPILDEEKPAIVVIMIGANDRQQIHVNGTSAPVRSDPWTSAYTARVEAVAKAVTRRHLPLLWVGMPAFRSSSMSEDILAFDGIYRNVTTKTGGEFVDTWEGFVDENGKFVFTGSDINGQQARLRGSDGINFTNAGKRKLAFYAEKPIRRLLGDAASGVTAAPIALQSPDRSAPAEQGPQLPEAITRTPPIGLQDPGLDGATTLLGGSPLPAAADTPRTKLVNDGTLAPPPAGRADAFAWKQTSADISPADNSVAKPATQAANPGEILKPDPMRANAASVP